ncbi:hypothetical protein AEYBE204_07920 [Asticcacaulis sp. YBE204]|nr:hypothetical protein AEYBE204_07920 [Asticcacaulis sp. YBE204]
MTRKRKIYWARKLYMPLIFMICLSYAVISEASIF